MADNLVINRTTEGGGANIALEDIGAGILAQRIKLILGSVHTDGGDVSAANPMPISDAAGSITVDGTVTASNTTGNVAHDAADSGNPVKVGGRAIAIGASPTAVASNDRTDAFFTRHGQLWTIGGHPNIQSFHKQYTADITDDKMVDVATGLVPIITEVCVNAGGDNSGNPAVRCGLGSAATPTGAKVAYANGGIVPGAEGRRGDGSATLVIGADGDDFYVTIGGLTSGAIDVTFSYFLLPAA